MITKDALNQETIRTANREKILHLLMEKREMTKQDISKKTGISIRGVGWSHSSSRGKSV